jgi:hypothetical protein
MHAFHSGLAVTASMRLDRGDLIVRARVWAWGVREYKLDTYTHGPPRRNAGHGSALGDAAVPPPLLVGYVAPSDRGRRHSPRDMCRGHSAMDRG